MAEVTGRALVADFVTELLIQRRQPFTRAAEDLDIPLPTLNRLKRRDNKVSQETLLRAEQAFSLPMNILRHLAEDDVLETFKLARSMDEHWRVWLLGRLPGLLATQVHDRRVMDQFRSQAVVTVTQTPKADRQQVISELLELAALADPKLHDQLCERILAHLAVTDRGLHDEIAASGGKPAVRPARGSSEGRPRRSATK